MEKHNENKVYISTQDWRDERQYNRVRIGKVIANARIAAGMTTRGLAEETRVVRGEGFGHLDHATITKIEQGRYASTLDTLWEVLTPMGYRLTIEPIPDEDEEEMRHLEEEDEKYVREARKAWEGFADGE